MLLVLHLFSKFEIIPKAKVKIDNNSISKNKNKTLNTVRAALSYPVWREYKI